jgi:H+/Cl- antiporter ClcA
MNKISPTAQVTDVRSTYADVWRYMAVFLAGAVCVGLAAASFTELSRLAHAALYRWLALSPYLPLLVTPLCFALLLWFTRKFFLSAQGGGISQTIAALERGDPGFRGGLLPASVIGSKMALTALGQACGAPLGREGPMIHIGASIMYAFGRFVPAGLLTKAQIDYGLILAGGGAGVAAAFHAPLAGIMFAIEELACFRARARTVAVAALVVVAASAVAAFIAPGEAFFGHADAKMALAAHWREILASGIVCGLAGGVFSRFLVSPGKLLPRRLDAFRLASPIGFAALCGLAVALLGLLSDNATYGNGSREAQLLMQDAGALSGWYAPLKFAAAWIAFLSGVPGGIFAPSLAIGAGIGADIALWMPAAAPDAVVLLCIAGFFAGVTQAPLTACLVVMEMNGDYGMALPLIATTIVASACSRPLCRRPLYHALAERLLAAEREKR